MSCGDSIRLGDLRGSLALALASGAWLASGCYVGIDDSPAVGADDSTSSASEGTSEGGVPQDPAGCSLISRRVWKLTPTQISATVATMIPTVQDAGAPLVGTLIDSGGYSNAVDDLEMTVPHVAEIHRFADGLAEHVVDDPGPVFPCLATNRDAACIEDFVRDFAGKGFRRPLAPEEVAGLVQLYDDELAANGADAALGQLVRGVLMSPSFHYRTELGEDDGAGGFTLTPYELASAISYLVTDGPPDAELLEAAQAGDLASQEVIAAQVERLLSAPATASGVLKFLSEHLGSEDITAVVKDAAAAPEFSTELAASMKEETARFIEHVLWQDDARFGTLLTASYSVIDPALASLYGVPPPASGGFERVGLPEGERAGLLTQPGMMALLSRQNTTDPVHRGKFIRQVLLCTPLPPPPADVNAIPPPPSEELTKREQLEIHSADPTCAACHDLMDPLGLAFESYDLLGRFRLEENGKVLDLGGELDPGSGVRFDDALDLVDLLATDQRAQRCFVDATLRYAVGRALDEGDRCAADSLSEAFTASDGDVIALFAEIVASERFRRRAGD